MKKSIPLILTCGFAAFVTSVSAANVAKIGDIYYETLNDAISAASQLSTPAIITLVDDVDLTEVIPVTADLTLDLNGHTITNNVTQNRAFRLSGVTFTIDGNGGSIITPETNTASYGFVDFRDMSGTASPAASLKVSDTTFKGGTDEGSLFAFRADGQAISLDNVNVELTPSHTYSIVNGYQKQVDIDVNGGEFVCNSTHTTAGVFQAGAGSTIDFTGAKVTTSVGPIFEVIASTANFTDCDFTNTATNSYFASCVSVSNGGTANINGGTYSANYPVYVYNSGGTINVKDGTFDGKIAAIKADNSVYENSPSKVTVENGTFNGDLQIGDKSELSLSGGTYTDPSAAEYCADGFTLETNADGTYGVVEDTIPSGIETVVTDSQVTSGAVYNLHGVKVADTFEGLPAGLYILNGHKVILNR